MKFTKPLLFGFFIVAVVVLGFMVWANSVFVPASEAFGALRSDEQVTVSLDRFVVFQPARKKTTTTAFVFYPGARVDYRSYAVPLHKIAAEGYLVILLPVRLNLALLDVNAADRAISAFPAIRHWAIGGHSLGGVAAATYASRHDIDGLVLWASYPSDDSLKNSKIRIISIYGTQDISGITPFENSQALLPFDAKYVVIQGGNHAQFGDYGVQPGDHEATITRTDQQKQVVGATVQFLKELSQ